MSGNNGPSFEVAWAFSQLFFGCDSPVLAFSSSHHVHVFLSPHLSSKAIVPFLCVTVCGWRCYASLSHSFFNAWLSSLIHLQYHICCFAFIYSENHKYSFTHLFHSRFFHHMHTSSYRDHVFFSPPSSVSLMHAYVSGLSSWSLSPLISKGSFILLPPSSVSLMPASNCGFFPAHFLPFCYCSAKVALLFAPPSSVSLLHASVCGLLSWPPSPLFSKGSFHLLPPSSVSLLLASSSGLFSCPLFLLTIFSPYMSHEFQLRSSRVNYAFLLHTWFSMGIILSL